MSKNFFFILLFLLLNTVPSVVCSKESISQEKVKRNHEWYKHNKKKNQKFSKYFSLPLLAIINEKFAHVSLGDDNMTANRHAFLDEAPEIYAGYFTIAVGIELIRRIFFP